MPPFVHNILYISPNQQSLKYCLQVERWHSMKTLDLQIPSKWRYDIQEECRWLKASGSLTSPLEVMLNSCSTALHLLDQLLELQYIYYIINQIRLRGLSLISNNCMEWIIKILDLSINLFLWSGYLVKSELSDLIWHLIRINHHLKCGELILIQS